ncbi:hypothetical protein [Litoreibacter halocynthiae]|nr:hypothetical protein [Litoreibacter halocynthiae]
MLLTFAQLEREETTDRIRDKIAASKRGGFGWAATCLWVLIRMAER